MVESEGLSEEEQRELTDLQSLTTLTPEGEEKVRVLIRKKYGLPGGKPPEGFFEELETRVNRSILFDLAHDGILYNEERARAGPCECFTLPSGRLYCWDKGVIGALSQDQIRTFCPPTNIVPRAGRIPERIVQFTEASQACEIGKTFDGRTVTNLQERLECMSKEAARRGIRI